jgi:hypothetical protein
MVREIRHLSTEMNGRTSRSAGSSSGTHLSYDKRFVGITGHVVIIMPILDRTGMGSYMDSGDQLSTWAT